MPSNTASGLSAATDTNTAITEALTQAAARLGGTAPNLGFVFVGSNHDLGAALAAARAAHPGADILGCTTAGELTEQGLVKGGISVMLAHIDGHFDAAFSDVGNVAAAAANLSEGYRATKSAAAASGGTASTSVVLVDGLAGVGEDLVQAVRKGTSPVQQIVGGAAGDDGKFEATYVGLNEQSRTGAAAVVHTFGSDMWGVGVHHGLRAATDTMEVTRSEGNVVHEIDGRPAFEAYRAFAKTRGQDLEPDTAGGFMIAHELGIHFLDELDKARAPLSVGANGELSCAAGIPEGSMVSILDGGKDDLAAAALTAAQEAKRNLGGKKAAGILLFDCICRGIILDDEFHREIDAIKEVFPDTPITGFLTYGEIARYKGKLDGWHNTTAVVVAIPE